MAYTLMRTAHSTFVKETEDFSCGLLDAGGTNLRLPHRFGRHLVCRPRLRLGDLRRSPTIVKATSA